MPNTFDEFGQPLVMMPYPQQQPTSPDVPTTSPDAVAVDRSGNTDLQVESPIALDDSSAVTDSTPGIKNNDPVPEAFMDADREVSEEHQDEMVQLSFSGLVKSYLKTSCLPQIKCVPSCNEIIDPQSVTFLQIDEQQPEATPENQALSTTEECPEDGEECQVNNSTMPLDPASSSFYPQSPMYTYYPMVFTPQQLPPNTSIIPLAGE